jgi:cytochrome c-type biogenesis protein CcmF
MGIGPLLAWRKTSPAMAKRAFFAPLTAGLAMGILHLVFGRSLRFPPFVTPDRIYEGFVGSALQKVGTVLPLVSTVLCAFNVAVIVQEYTRGLAARRRATKEAFLPALIGLVAKARHRYGGYVVHLGIVIMFLGFTGRSWGVDKEVSLKPGETFQVDHYELRYTSPRMEVDQTKRMIFADLAVTDMSTGKGVGRASPAKFIYRRMPESPTTEVSMLHSIRDDLYVIVGEVNAETKMAAFHTHVNPFVSWIWFGVLVLISGAVISMWPEVVVQEARVWSYVKMAGGLTSAILFGLLIALAPSLAYGQSSSSLHAGTVEINDPTERTIFSRLLCQCGGCPQLPLTMCICDTAKNARSRIRDQLARGDSPDVIVANYVSEFGAAALTVPPNEGALRLIYGVPIVASLGGLGVVLLAVRRWKRRDQAVAGAPVSAGSPAERDEYDAKLDEELKKLDG